MKDKPENHNWIPQYIFSFTTHDKPVMIILWCPHCKSYRYQYGESII